MPWHQDGFPGLMEFESGRRSADCATLNAIWAYQGTPQGSLVVHGHHQKSRVCMCVCVCVCVVGGEGGGGGVYLRAASLSMGVPGFRKCVTSAMWTPTSKLPDGRRRTCNASSMSLQPGGSTLQIGSSLKSSLCKEPSPHMHTK